MREWTNELKEWMKKSEKIKLYERTNERTNERNECGLIGRMYQGEYEYWGVVGERGER